MLCSLFARPLLQFVQLIDGVQRSHGGDIEGKQFINYGGSEGKQRHLLR